jgi:histidine transport system permease protein
MIQIIHQYGLAYLCWDGYRISGLAMTLWLLIISCVVGFCLALPLAIARNSKNPLIWFPVWLFTFLFRGTPLYVQLLLINYGIYGFSFIQHTAPFNEFFRLAFNCTCVSFALNTGAYTTVIFAGAIKETSFGEVDAARAMGMSMRTMYRRIIIPSALRRALPVYSNEVILMLHATTLAFTATVPDILKVANDAYSATYDPFDSFSLAAVIYLCVSFALIFGFRRAERHFLAFLQP